MSGRKGITQTSAVKDTNYNYIFIIFKTNSRTAAENSAVVFFFGVQQENIPRKVACNKKKRGKKKNEKKNLFFCSRVTGDVEHHAGQCHGGRKYRMGWNFENRAGNRRGRCVLN